MSTLPRPRSPWPVVILGCLALLGFTALYEVRDPSRILAWISLEQQRIHSLIESAGPLAPLGFIAAYAALMLLIWFPSWPCSMAGGFLFGPLPALLYSAIGSTLGALGVFELARAGVGRWNPRDGTVFRGLDEGFRRNALEYLIVLRVIPVMPFGVVHVAAAVLGVEPKVFVLGTALGMLPCIYIYGYLGAQVAAVAAAGRPLDLATFVSPNVSVPLFALAALALVPALIRRLRTRALAK